MFSGSYGAKRKKKYCGEIYPQNIYQRSDQVSEVMYDPATDEIILKEPGFIGSVDGYRYLAVDNLEKDLGRLLTNKKIIERLISLGDL